MDMRRQANATKSRQNPSKQPLFAKNVVACTCVLAVTACRAWGQALANETNSLQAKRILFYQLPSRKFWIWWCGGLHVLDFMLVLTWLAFNLMWAYFTVSPKYVSIRGGRPDYLSLKYNTLLALPCHSI